MSKIKKIFLYGFVHILVVSCAKIASTSASHSPADAPISSESIKVKQASQVELASTDTSASAEITEAELQTFGEKIFDIHARQAKEEYLELLHPDCPAPISEAIDYDFSRKWLRDEAHDIRIKKLEDQYDMSQVSFKVQPAAALEFQTWTTGEGGKRELVTGLAIAKYNGELKGIDYPCFE